ncbi:MAG TPA: DUF4234 domain-containing protein [Deltaproteobacteria bacterium]|nr:DUF4234 domain-containing protein [Deltaproteobacteria bacterium]
MMERQIIERLKNQSTWRLLGLSIITYFVYAAHYIYRQTKIINDYYNGTDKISDGLVNSILIFSYLSLFLFIGYLFAEDSHPIVSISKITDFISGILYIVWGFKARNRMNKILQANELSNEWFHGLWTFLFTPLYFNYKVNHLHELEKQRNKGKA